MSSKAVDKFFMFLNENKLTRLTPAAFTKSEIMTYADQNDFHFSKDALNRKIHDIQISEDGKLNDIEKVWKNVL